MDCRCGALLSTAALTFAAALLSTADAALYLSEANADEDGHAALYLSEANADVEDADATAANSRTPKILFSKVPDVKEDEKDGAAASQNPAFRAEKKPFPRKDLSSFSLASCSTWSSEEETTVSSSPQGQYPLSPSEGKRVYLSPIIV